MQLDELAAADPLSNPDGDPAGSWCEREFTGTGFPKVFYLRYHLYRLSFPVMAIGRYLGAHGRGLRGRRLIDLGEREALFAPGPMLGSVAVSMVEGARRSPLGP